tara:strand:- start:37 stop:291 length:255 start_codon:yes stop_codon:yes gene_type:complete
VHVRHERCIRLEAGREEGEEGDAGRAFALLPRRRLDRIVEKLQDNLQVAPSIVFLIQIIIIAKNIADHCVHKASVPRPVGVLRE